MRLWGRVLVWWYRWNNAGFKWIIIEPEWLNLDGRHVKLVSLLCMHLKFTVIKSLKTIKPAKGFIKWGVPISTHVAESTRKAAWGASAGGFGLYQWVPLKQQFRSNL